MEALGEGALLNPEGFSRVLDLMIASLQGIRSEVADGDRDRLLERLDLALAGRQRWLSERIQADWTKPEKVELSEIPNLAERLFGSTKHLRRK